MQELTGPQIRLLTGVSRKDNWPLWEDPMPERLEQGTGQRYMDPNFEADVLHPANAKIIERTVQVIWGELTVRIDQILLNRAN